MQYSNKTVTKIQKENDFHFKKKFGQNFIVDENTINSIINKAEIDKNSLVIEIGPGMGSLTYKLSDQAKHVLCYEIDESLKEPLTSHLKEKQNVDIIFGDFLKATVNEDIKKYEYNKLYIIANLPYYITTPIIFKIIEDKLDVEKVVIMVQKEVGDRLKAKPKTKEYNSLSIFINYYFDVKKLMDVSRRIFIPMPNVDSIVIELKKKEQRLKLLNEEVFFKLVKASFVQKRKTIKNNLMNYDLNLVEKVLTENGYSLTSRAEEIDIETFAKLANEIATNV